ncbi:MAG: HAMP domain-containing histidine kinase [Desulfobulbaceae bacterium]|nr:HAMP domain-containing histidine kinase [Desulfobulbaceae bacterium]
MIVKILTLILLTGFITAEHVLYHNTVRGIHVLHQQLFFIPLILASFWYGLRVGVTITTAISLLYVIPVVLHNKEASSQLVVMTQICIYFSVAILIGWLSDRKRREQSRLFQKERSTALRKASSALIFIIQDIILHIENIYAGGDEGENSSKRGDIETEISRLKRLLETLTQFNKPQGGVTLANNLNDLILDRIPVYHQSAASKGVKVETDLKQGGCPSMITTESVLMIIDSVVDNAIDFSKRGQSIILRLKRKGDFCLFEVEDFGPGVSKENETKLFTVFFTTKSDGYGLSLSSGRKVLRDLGGDLLYNSKENAGSIFTVKIPRESPEQKVQEYDTSETEGEVLQERA